jgi:S-adenosylmethionine-diacylglycerol 3-amino-3-carboxypropyl transferase
MMTVAASETRRATQYNLKRAVSRHRPLSKAGLQERLFTLMFSGLVYPQIWEDPAIDMEALALGADDHVVAIASGGCNILSYLVAGPARITAVDLNENHVALGRLKLAAARHLPDHGAFFRFFGEADSADNVRAYEHHLRDRLDTSTRRYWDRRNLVGRRRIGHFSSNLYRKGLLGWMIGTGHAVARLHGRDPRRMLAARSLAEQRTIFDRELKPIFSSGLVKWLVSNPASLYGLGIPPAQYQALLSSARDGGGMEQVLVARLERLACGFPLEENYFAWQAFGRRYQPGRAGAVPPYLAEANFAAIRDRAERVEVRHENFIDHLASCPPASRDAYVLLDAQDWMTDEVLGRLWSEITRTARPGARVIFRTAAEASLLPGRLPPDLLARWCYDAARCRAFTERDRSSIYGGFHLYTLKAS